MERTDNIILAGLGPGSQEALTLGVLDTLKKAQKIFLRTAVHPVVNYLKEQGITFQSFDEEYQKANDFQQLYQKIAQQVLTAAAIEPVVYAVPGHPFVAEETVQLIIKGAEERGLQVKILPATSFLDELLKVLHYDPIEGLQILDALTLAQKPPVIHQAAVITQVYSRLVASEVKLSLMEIYEDEHQITVVRGAGVPREERVETIPLYQLDRLEWVDHLTSVFVPPARTAEKTVVTSYPLDRLVEIIAILRSEQGCPWDREQTHESLKQCLLEETYEVLEALDTGDQDKICDELGDLLLQVVFHAQIARENNHFDVNDVVKVVTEKMIRRHPHVFGDIEVKNSAEVLVNWDKIKAKEKNQNKASNSRLGSVPQGLPALVRANKLQQKATQVGFDWPDYTGALAKVKEELNEVIGAIESQASEEIRQEIGDLFFALVNLARLLKVDSEGALTFANGKFISRFQHIEKRAKEADRELSQCTLEEMDRWWDEAKSLEIWNNGKNIE